VASILTAEICQPLWRQLCEACKRLKPASNDYQHQQQRSGKPAGSHVEFNHG